MSKHCFRRRFPRPQRFAWCSLALALLIVLGLTPGAAFSKVARSTPEAAAPDSDHGEPDVNEAALTECQGKLAEYTAASADQAEKAKELVAIIEEDKKKAAEHTSTADSLEKKAAELAATAAEHEEQIKELSAAAAEQEKKAAELAATATSHEKKAAELKAAAASHKEKAAKLAATAVTQKDKVKELNRNVTHNKEKAVEEAAAAASLKEKIKQLAATAAGHEDKAKELAAFVASLEGKMRETDAAASAGATSAETEETESPETAIAAPVTATHEGEAAVKLKRGQISKADLRKFQVIFFGIGFIISLFFLLSPMFLPSYRSVGSPSEIIEETGLGAKNTDGKKVLVAYDTRHGTTAKTAQNMGRMFADKGCQVDVRCLKNMMEEDISSYDAYVVGSWIYYMGISMATVEFLKKFKDQLTSKPTAYFVVCGKLLTGTAEEVGDVVRTYIKKAETEVPEIKPLDLGMFPGGVVLSKLSFWERMQMHIKMRKLTEPRMKEGVFIDDSLLDEWTTKIVGLIK